MNQKMSPAVTAAIVIVVVVLLGFVGMKYVTTQSGVKGEIPAVYSNPGGAGSANPVTSGAAPPAGNRPMGMMSGGGPNMSGGSGRPPGVFR